MRDFRGLNVNDGGEPVTTPAPASKDIEELENHFHVTLPENYLSLLNFANGGHPEASAFDYGNSGSGSAVDAFHSITGDRENITEVYKNTEYLRGALSEVGLNTNVIAVAVDGGDNQIYLDMSVTPPPVYMLYRTDNNSNPKVADNFEEFIDKLYIPSYDDEDDE